MEPLYYLGRSGGRHIVAVALSLVRSIGRG